MKATDRRETKITISKLATGPSHKHINRQGAPVPETGLALSDVTTKNFGTSMHGFCPKSSGVAGQYLQSDGTWAVPGGGGGGLTQAQVLARCLGA